MEPYTQEQRAEIARLMSEGCSYFEAVMKMLGMTDVKVCINGKSVQLDGIGAKASILGGLKAQITEVDSSRPPQSLSPPPQPQPDQPTVTVQGGFVDPLYGSGPAMGSASAILLAHKKEVTQRLIVLNRKSRLTGEEEAEKKELIEELRKINGT